MGYRWMSDALKHIADLSRTQIRLHAANHPFYMIHDNIRVVFHKETQRTNNQTHGDNGTAATLIEIPEQYRDWPHIDGDNLLEPETLDRIRSFKHGSLIRLLLKTEEFAKYEHGDSPYLAFPDPIHPLPTGPDYQVKQHMFPAVPIEETTSDGNLLVLRSCKTWVDMTSVVQDIRLGTDLMIPWLGDQLTFARLKHLKQMRQMHRCASDRLDYLTPVFGWFHAKMLIGEVIFENYRDSKAG
ncbi:hypothetical protein SISSUDRAFT_972472, partial [Sistotremastrum suecicum HHB10207 ss-3]